MADYAATGLPPAYLPKASATAVESLPPIEDETADPDGAETTDDDTDATGSQEETP
jgi:hypothetical protein